MKNFIQKIILALAWLAAAQTQLQAQGTLTPSGAPAPTMKSLAQIEPRTDVLKLSGDASNLYLITNSGSYYLTTNVLGVALKNGIGIRANNVTLDLNGFALSGMTNGSGVYIGGSTTNITVRNGKISRCGANCVEVASASAHNVVLEDLNVSDSSASGIFCNNGLVSRCTVFNSNYRGINAVNSVVRDCLVDTTTGPGIYAYSSTVSGCLVQNAAQSGIYVNGPGCLITDNNCNNNNLIVSGAEAGIYVNDSNNRIENNHVTANGNAGIKVNNATYINNIVIKNSVSGNGGNNYLGTVNNDFGPISTAATATSPWANLSH